MTKILILTDNVEEWVQKVEDDFTVIHGIKTKQFKLHHLQTTTADIIIKNGTSGCERGAKYDLLLVDKEIDNKILEEILFPQLVMGKVIFTKRSNRNDYTKNLEGI